jgi:hypothetical protein
MGHFRPSHRTQLRVDVRFDPESDQNRATSHHPVDAGASAEIRTMPLRTNLPHAKVTTYSNAAIASTTPARIGPASLHRRQAGDHVR